MGHQRIGPLRPTRAWNEVVGLLTAGASTRQVAIASVHAAQRAFRALHQDLGTRLATGLLLRLPRCARQPDLCGTLHDLGLCVPARPGVLDLAVALTDAVDDALPNNRRRTDLGEMAQLAAAESLIGHLREQTRSLFGTTPETVQAALASWDDPARFAAFARRYFARLVYRVLDYHLGRVLGEQVGGGRRFLTLADARAFQRDLEEHCFQVAAVVVPFTADWVGGRRRDDQPFDADTVADYTHGAVAKILQVFDLELGEGVPCRVST